MLLYIEKQAKDYPQTKKILEKFKNSQVIFINNYKNLFDKNYDNLNSKKALIVAKLNSSSVSEAPDGYGHTKYSYFFKTSLNCVYDCSYCYLKGAFKNENMVVFVNYDDIKKEIEHKIKEIALSKPLPINGTTFSQAGKESDQFVDSSLPLMETERGVWFYSSDYSDILGMDTMSGFCQEFIPFFELFGPPPSPPKKVGYILNSLNSVMMEIRTKSGNIKPLLDLGFVPKNTEIAFSLNPQEMIDNYEKGTSSLEWRINAINKLLDLGFLVGVRFLPLLPVKNYEKIYGDFVEYIKENIDMCKINSVFASGLLYTKKDYNKILSKYPDLDILHMLDLNNDGFYRESKKVRDTFYKMFKNLDNRCILCLEN